ncbi:hypothetical protein Slin15195_G014670 [Septoria linicola]|uniref:Uncharacterized protein n=1 Tax=Septoria linicola TaxID=215465 RepID=A0A9Q9AL64_9PEZI|nr:hypothetical protein Slin15195_G014670 [Septoria linicola]
MASSFLILLTRAMAEDVQYENFPPLRPPTRQVSLDESRRSTPPIPPGFEGHVGIESRRGTPSVPPGLTRPSALPDLEGTSSRPTSRPSSRASLRRQTSQILPALPLRPGTPHRVATPSKLDHQQDVDQTTLHETPTKSSRPRLSSDLKVANSADSVERVLEPQASETLASTEAIPDVDVARTQVAKPVPTVQKSTTKPGDDSPAGVDDSKSPEKVTKSKKPNEKVDSAKRKHPGKLDITAAVANNDASSPATAGADTQRKTQPTATTAAVPTPPQPKHSESPMASPAIRTAPRTLRVVQTPKAETPSAVAPSLPSMASAVAAHKLPSRQPSVASIVLPGTPSSEHISMSDNISMASTSQSRANSPPPPAVSKVGSAPVRAKTKSQQKKDRQERAKALEEEKAKGDEANNAQSDEPVIEAIQSRKKKAKKEKEVRPKPKATAAATTATADTTPTTSRPPSPKIKPVAEAPFVPEPEPVPAQESKPATPVRTTPSPPQVLHSSSGPSPPATPTLTPAQMLAEMKSSAPQLQKCIDNFFRVTTGKDFKTHHNISHKDLVNHWQAELKFNLTKNDVDALLKGKVPAIHYGGEEGRAFDRGMITPSGASLRALTKDLESRFLELERALREMPEESRFRSTKPQNDMKLPFIDLEAMRRQFENGAGRGPSVMEQMVQDGATMKKGAFLVDEASKYINEFVMPPVTPPPSAVNTTRAHQAPASASGPSAEQVAPSLDIAERQLKEAQRHAEEKENALRKIIKKNKKLLGVA